MFWKTFFLLLTYKPQPLQLPSRKKYSDSIQLSTFVVFFFFHSFIYLSGHCWKNTVICCSRTGQQSGLFSRMVINGWGLFLKYREIIFGSTMQNVSVQGNYDHHKSGCWNRQFSSLILPAPFTSFAMTVTLSNEHILPDAWETWIKWRVYLESFDPLLFLFKINT